MSVILPDILETDPQIFQVKLDKALTFSPRIHIDLIDSSYTVAPSLMAGEWPEFPKNSQISTHIMVQNPMSVVDVCIKKGAKQLIVQLEGCNQQVLVNYLRKKNVSVGLAIDLPTLVARLDRKILPYLNAVLLMSVKAGKSGQAFDTRVISKIRQVRDMCGENTEIMVDGGINPETGKPCLTAGADTLVVNSFLWQNPEINWQKLQQLG